MFQHLLMCKNLMLRFQTQFQAGGVEGEGLNFRLEGIEREGLNFRLEGVEGEGLNFRLEGVEERRELWSGEHLLSLVVKS